MEWLSLHFVHVLQGYNNLLKDIFEDAGLLKSRKVKVKVQEAAADSERQNSLEKCKAVCNLSK